MQIQVLDSYLHINPTFYAASQSKTGAANLDLNYSAHNALVNTVVSTPQWNQGILFTSGTTDNSGVTVSIIGVDYFGNIVSETGTALSPPNSTTRSQNRYSSLISITTTGAVTDLSVGINGSGSLPQVGAVSIPFKMSTNITMAQWAVQTVVSGTIDYDIQYTLYPFNTEQIDEVNWLSDNILAPGGNSGSGTVVGARTASLYFNFLASVYAIRFRIKENANNTTFKAFIAQQGTL